MNNCLLIIINTKVAATKTKIVLMKDYKQHPAKMKSLKTLKQSTRPYKWSQNIHKNRIKLRLSKVIKIRYRISNLSTIVLKLQIDSTDLMLHTAQMLVKSRRMFSSSFMALRERKISHQIG